MNLIEQIKAKAKEYALKVKPPGQTKYIQRRAKWIKVKDVLKLLKADMEKRTALMAHLQKSPYYIWYIEDGEANKSFIKRYQKWKEELDKHLAGKVDVECYPKGEIQKRFQEQADREMQHYQENVCIKRKPLEKLLKHLQETTVGGLAQDGFAEGRMSMLEEILQKGDAPQKEG